MEKRIIALETKVAFQEDLIEDLNKSLFEAHQKIETLSGHIKQLKGQIQSGEIVRKLEDEEPPPHY